MSYRGSTITPSNITIPGSNDSDDEPCLVNFINYRSNCSRLQHRVDQYGNPIIASISFASILLNVVMILAILERRREKRTPSQLHLLALTSSDLFIGLCSIWLAISSWTAGDICQPCRLVKTCFRNMEIAVLFNAGGYMLNRYLMLFVTFFKARDIRLAVRSFISPEDMTKCRVVAEFFISIVLVVVSMALPTFLIVYFLSFLVASFTFRVVTAVAMAVMAAYIGVELHVKRRNPSDQLLRSPDEGKDEFKKLVALIAIVYCCDQCIGAIYAGLVAFAGDVEGQAAMENTFLFWKILTDILNSCVPLLLYIWVSRNFRKAVVKFWKRIVCCSAFSGVREGTPRDAPAMPDQHEG